MDRFDRLELALASLGLRLPSPVLVLVGGAARIDPGVSDPLLHLFQVLAPWLDHHGVTVIDGATAYGVMALMGAARRHTGARFPLLGVAAAGTVARPEGPPGLGAELEPNHSHFLLVPGARWGDESPWISAAASALSQGLPAITLVAAGGEVTRLDVAIGLAAARPHLVIAGSGGTADALARWIRTGEPVPEMSLGGSERVLVEVLDLARAGDALPDLLSRIFCV